MKGVGSISRGSGRRSARKGIGIGKTPGKSREQLELENRALMQAQFALETTRDRYADFYEAAPVCFLTLTRNGIIDEVNVSAIQLLKHDRGQLVGMPFAKLIARADRKPFLEHLAHCRQNWDPTRPLSVELTLAHKPDVAPVYIRLISTPAPPKNNKASSAKAAEGLVFRCVFMDITEQKRADAILRESDYYKALRNSDGVTPATRRKTCAKWLGLV